MSGEPSKGGKKTLQSTFEYKLSTGSKVLWYWVYVGRVSASMFEEPEKFYSRFGGQEILE